MSHASDHTEHEHDSDLDRLLAEYVERAATEGDSVIEALCEENPAQADALRSAVRLMQDYGIADSETDARTPLELDDFEILREVGRGGMGVVYEARERALDRRVAVKVLLAHLTHDRPTIERFRREGRLVGSLEHPGIVKVHTIGAAAGHDYLVMEFLEGAPLDQVLDAARERPGDDSGGLLAAATETLGGTTPFARNDFEFCARIVADVCTAAEFAHRAGIVHRDIKPSNIFLRPDGSPVLTDFGLARRDDLPGLTRSGTTAGTPAYMAPEQTTPGRPIDARTDVFSIGATLYELLTLRRPFSGETGHELMRAIQTRDPIAPGRLNRDTPGDLSAIVLKALEKRPERRYPTCAAFAEDLRAFLAYRPVSARHASAIERGRRWVARQPALAALLAVLAISIPSLTGLAGVWWANRDKVAAGETLERRARTDRAIDQAYMTGFGSENDATIAALQTALDLEPDNLEAVAGMAMHLLAPTAGTDPEQAERARRSLDYLDSQPSAARESRVLRRIRAWGLDAAGETDAGERILAELGDPAESLESFWTGIHVVQTSLRHDSTRRHEAIAHLQTAQMLAPRPRPAIFYYLTSLAGEQGDEAVARRAAAALQRHWPDSFLAWRGIGLALFDLDPAAAVRAYRRALELRDDNAVRVNLAHALSRQGRSDEAIAEWQKAIELDPNYSRAHAAIGREYFARRSDPETALVHLRRAVELEPRELVAQHYLLWVLCRTGQLDEALAAAHEAIEVMPEEPLLRQGLANVLGDRGDISGARDALRECVKLAPRDPRTRRQLGDLHRDLGELDEAEAAYEAAIEVAHPDDRDGYRMDLGHFLLRGNPPRDAERALVMAEQLAEATTRNDPWVLELLALALEATGDLNAARAALSSTIEVADRVEHASRAALARRARARLTELEKRIADQ